MDTEIHAENLKRVNKSEDHIHGLSFWQRFQKRSFDLFFAGLGLLLTWWLILIAVVLATFDTREWGVFRQRRIGRWGKPFTIYKIRTMRTVVGGTSVTTRHDSRITLLGRFFRKTKIDELPQLLNVFRGDMSFVGPRPDVPGFADKLSGEERLMLSIRPGITGPATLRYRDEEELLAKQEDPETYNSEVIFPEKVRLNLDYIRDYSLLQDVKCIVKTLIG